MSEGVEWSLHSVSLLSMLPPGASLPGKAIAEFHGVSESYLLKHLKALVAAGILASVPGPRGGYRLARDADAVTFLDVVQAIEGPEPTFRCTEIRQRGPAPAGPDLCRMPCAIHRTMREAEAAWMATLRQKSIATIRDELMSKLSPDQIARATGWLTGQVRTEKAH
ncbi:MAG TPA: Rrf2 family transcriptional regulator [Oscillatoriaceae cyanobacterium]